MKKEKTYNTKYNTLWQLGEPIPFLVQQIRAPAGNPTGRHISDMNFSMIQKCQSSLKSLLREIKTAEFVGFHRQNMDFWRIPCQMHKKYATNYSHFLGADSSDAVRDLSNSSPSLIDHVCETCQHMPWFHTDICTSRQEW